MAPNFLSWSLRKPSYDNLQLFEIVAASRCGGGAHPIVEAGRYDNKTRRSLLDPDKRACETMKRFITAVRVLLGLAFTVLPLMAILKLTPTPPPPPAAASFAGALAQSGYMLPLIWGTEITSGVLLLLGLFVPFALVLLAPVMVNIVAFHFFLTPHETFGISLALFLSALELVLMWHYRRAFAPLFVYHGEAGAEKELAMANAGSVG